MKTIIVNNLLYKINILIIIKYLPDYPLLEFVLEHLARCYSVLEVCREPIVFK